MGAFLVGAPLRTTALVGVGLVATAAATYVSGGTKTVLPQLAHLFVVAAAITLGPRIAAVAGLTAGLLLGPLMPLSVADGTTQSFQNWLLRTAVFIGVGVGTGILARGLRHSDMTLRETLSALPVAVAVINEAAPQAHITYANTQAVALLGEIEGEQLADVFAGAQVRTIGGRRINETELETAPTAVVAGDVPALYEMVDVRGRRRTVQVRALRAASGQAVAVIADITAQVRFDESRRHLITLAGHHMRTPLTPIVGFSRLVTAHARDAGDDVLVPYGEALERNSQRLWHLVERLTDLAQLEPAPRGLYRDVPVRPLVHTVVSALDMDQAVETHGDDLTASIVPRHLEIALQEVMDNARAHGALPVTVTTRHEGGRVVLTISDTGPGLPDSLDQERVFEPYSGVGTNPDTDAPRGTGLGLALARAHCHATGATLVYHPPTRTFTIGLPPTSDQRHVRDHAR